MRALILAMALSGATLGGLAALAYAPPPSGDLGGCKVTMVYEDGSFDLTCPPIADPEWGGDFDPYNANPLTQEQAMRNRT